jgi:hypothetical protein
LPHDERQNKNKCVANEKDSKGVAHDHQARKLAKEIRPDGDDHRYGEE